MEIHSEDSKDDRPGPSTDTGKVKESTDKESTETSGVGGSHRKMDVGKDEKQGRQMSTRSMGKRKANVTGKEKEKERVEKGKQTTGRGKGVEGKGKGKRKVRSKSHISDSGSD